MPNFYNPGVNTQIPEEAQILRRQKLAEQMLQQGNAPLEGQMISGHYVAPSWTQQLAKGLQTYMGNKELRESDKAMADYQTGQKTRRTEEIARIADLLSNKPAITLPEGQQGPVAPARGPDMAGALRFAAESDNPALQQWGLQGSMSNAQKQLEQEQANQLRQKYVEIWEKSGKNPKVAQTLGMPFDVVKQFAEAPNLGKQKGVVINGQLVDPITGTPIGQAVPKQVDMGSDLLIPDPNNPGKYIVNTQLLGAKKDIAKSGASSVSVNTGQKGFDNTLKLRSDFRSEPIYKAHQEMQSAYSQIGAGLKAGTPVGDLAAATKIMKLLDPGSVVRESELGMAMSASGLGDRLANYAQNVISGNKLTPQQRTEFKALADALYSESVNQYNAKQSEYKQIADRNQLNAVDVVGSQAQLPKPPASANSTSKANNQGFSIRPIP
jgi:hypothetical protein